MKHYTPKRTKRDIERIGLFSHSELVELVNEKDVPAVLRDLAKSLIDGDYERAIAIKNANKNGLLL